jgi:hypothetical protein
MTNMRITPGVRPAVTLTRSLSRSIRRVWTGRWGIGTGKPARLAGIGPDATMDPLQSLPLAEGEPHPERGLHRIRLPFRVEAFLRLRLSG